MDEVTAQAWDEGRLAVSEPAGGLLRTQPGRRRFAPLRVFSVYHLKRGVSSEKSGSVVSPDSGVRAKARVLAMCGGESGRAVLWA